MYMKPCPLRTQGYENKRIFKINKTNSSRPPLSRIRDNKFNAQNWSESLNELRNKAFSKNQTTTKQWGRAFSKKWKWNSSRPPLSRIRDNPFNAQSTDTLQMHWWSTDTYKHDFDGLVTCFLATKALNYTPSLCMSQRFIIWNASPRIECWQINNNTI
jgi:hypothetical protein